MPSIFGAAPFQRRAATVTLAAVLALSGMLIAQEEKSSPGSSDKSGAKSAPKVDEPSAKKPADAAAPGSEKPAQETDKEEAEAKPKQRLDEFLPPGSKAYKEAYQGTRPKRQPPEVLTKERNFKLEADEPKPAQEKQVDDFRRRGDHKPADVPLIELVVKWQVYSISDLKNFERSGKKYRDTIEQNLENPQNVDPKFLPLYKKLLAKYLQELLAGHLHSRINAMMLLAKLKDQELIPLFCQHIRDPEQHEAVKYWAVKGLMLLGQQKITQVEPESEAVTTLLGLLHQNEPVHRLTRLTIIQALGAIGRTTSVAIKRDADVAVAMIKIIRDPNIKRVDRSVAVVELSKLQVSQELDYNFQYVAYEIAQFAADCVAAAIADPATDDLNTHLFLLDSYEALIGERRERTPLAKRAETHALGKLSKDPSYVREMGEPVKKLLVTALKIYKLTPAEQPGKAGAPQPKGEDLVAKLKRIREDVPRSQLPKQLDELRAFLKNRPPRSMKVAPDAPDLGPPPALAGPMEPPEKKPDEAGPDSAPEAGEAKVPGGPATP